jgi:pyruvate kinase
MRRTRIIATVGPASDNDATLDAMMAAGADVFRLNFSHGTHDGHRATFTRIRGAAARAGRVVGILQDLGGPKIRTGPLKDGVPLVLQPGDNLAIATGDFEGENGRISTTYDGLARAVRIGDRLLLSDGAIELRVNHSDGREIRTTVVDGGTLGARKGISAPGVDLPGSAITPKDVDDLRFGLGLGVDMVAVSFVQTADDLHQARQVIRDAGGPDVLLVAKLERPQALQRLEEICAASDAVMVARGDLGLEMPLERVPGAQKEITRAARRLSIPVIVATQVLESMTHEARPTRAEVSDAANAVDDGVDAIMLAGETAIGVAAARVVQTLDTILREAESASGTATSAPAPSHHDHARALCEAAVTLAERGHAQAIVALTHGGSTARFLSALRPRAAIMAPTASAETARRLTLYWGVTPISLPMDDDVSAAAAQASRALVERGLLAAGTPVVLVNINPDLSRPDANYLKMYLPQP